MLTPWEKFMGAFWETIKIVVVALIIIIPMRAYVVQPFFVSGASMEPTFNNGDYLIVDEISYRFREPSRDEVVVFRFPQDPDQFYIKRIIGLPNEMVEIRDGDVYIYNEEHPEGFVADQNFFQKVGFTFGNLNVKLGSEEYFVLGDNRGASSDSRRWGPLKRDLIVGRVWLRALPVSKAEVFSIPQ
ncbi:signal peptidase I [Candidatus Parcubacteria bacterium]|nr:MAG: signal peptidase I [Candidatus Parcubacteria bacterium]